MFARQSQEIVSLESSLVAINYPGYFWCTVRENLYSIKVEGILKPLRLYKPNKFNNMPGPFYQISVKNSPIYITKRSLVGLRNRASTISIGD